MAKVTVSSTLSNITTQSDLQRFLSAFIAQLTQQVNGNIQFGANIASTPPITVGFTSGPLGVSHGLGRIPGGFLMLNQTASASIYSPQGASYAWTASKVYLQSSAGVTATFFLI